MISRARVESLSGEKLRAGLTNYIYPSTDRLWRDVYPGGWRPAFQNQQWGGAQWGAEMVDGTTGQVYKFDVATGYVENNSLTSIASAAFTTYSAVGFKVGSAINLAAVWLKLYKVGNPSNNFQVYIYSDNGSGKPSALISNGTATAQSGKLPTAKTDGEWYRFVFATPPSVSANTQYHIVMKSSGAVDASNYWVIIGHGSTKYPHGYYNGGDATPTWTSNTAFTSNFLVESVPANQFFQSGGQFDGKLVFSEGSPLNQSKALINPLRNFFDGQNFTSLCRVSSCQKGKPIGEFLYGLDHDRIQVMCNATTGYAAVNFYDTNRTLVTLTSSVDISVAAESDVAVIGRFAGDGADYLQLWVNGVKAAETTAQTYSVSKLMRELGTAWLGGGFPVAPAWTQDMQMTALPSTQGYTWNGVATEANAMSIQNGRLCQNKNGYGSTDGGFYSKTTAFSNATGWTVEWKCRVQSANNNNGIALNGNSVIVPVQDGTKQIWIYIQEYFVQSGTNGVVDATVQGDFRSQDHVFTLCGRGSDYYLFIDGRLAIDGTGKLTVTTATNSIALGDASTTAGDNADVSWSYMKYYQGGAILPQIATGMALHEYAHWSGNKGAYLPAMYNGGSPISVKQITGMFRNYVEDVQWTETRKGITSGPVTTSTSYVLATDLECFVIGDKARVEAQSRSTNNAANAQFMTARVDGVADLTGAVGGYCGVAGAETPLKVGTDINTLFGLHKIEGVVSVGGGTMTLSAQSRVLTVKGNK